MAKYMDYSGDLLVVVTNPFSALNVENENVLLNAGMVLELIGGEGGDYVLFTEDGEELYAESEVVDANTEAA